MEEQLKSLLDNWLDPKTRDKELLKQLYSNIMGITLDKCPKCETKALTELRKFYELTYVNKQKVVSQGRKYVLKPGNHQFMQGDIATHNNENTTDAEIEAYLQHYPHIRGLLI